MSSSPSDFARVMVAPLQRLCRVYGRAYTADVLDDWHHLLDDIPIGQVAAALDRAGRSSIRMPTPAEIRREVGVMREAESARPDTERGPAHVWTPEDLARARYLDAVLFSAAPRTLRPPRLRFGSGDLGERNERIVEAEAEWERTGRATWLATGEDPEPAWHEGAWGKRARGGLTRMVEAIGGQRGREPGEDDE